MLTISLSVVYVAVTRNWRNDQLGYKLNLGVVSWADLVWVFVVVLPDYVPLGRGFIPPAIWITGAVLTMIAQRANAHDIVRSASSAYQKLYPQVYGKCPIAAGYD
jgi:hypothetical protein